MQLWLTQFDRGELNGEEAEASVIVEYEARVTGLECKVGQPTLELDLAKKTPRQPTAADNEKSFTITGPRPVPLDGGAK
jgi:transposase